MKLIIDIDEESYKEIKKIVADGNDMFFTDKLIANGIPFDSFPEREKGEWIITYPNGKYNPIYECPKCKASNNAVFKNFCPNCGADMRGKANE